MEDFKKQICRLCLGVIPAGFGEVIEETNKEKLKLLLIDIDFDISDNAVACNRCLENLQDCFDFKSTCSSLDNYIPSCMNVDVKVDIKSVFEEAMSKENVNFENDQMCRLCMSLIKDQSFTYSIDLEDDFFLKDMLRNCFLEVDLNTAHVPLICKSCLSSAKKYSDFMKTCHEVEERIKNYCQVAEGYGIRARVILEDVLEFQNCGTLNESIVIKKEYLDVENEDMTAMECFNGENTASIKCEEVDIKEELDIQLETSESVQSGNCSNSVMNGSSKRKICAKTEEKQSLQGGRECYLCSFVTDTQSLLNAHMMSHKGSTKTFRCHQCPYESNRKSNLKQHFLRHKDESEVEMHKCPLCPYQSKYKSAVIEHRKLMHNTNNEVYNCKYCSYSTKHKDRLPRHQLVHENPEKILKHKCEKCDYETHRKSSLKQHFLRHKDESEVEMHNCPLCPYKSKYKRALIEHRKLKHDPNAKVYNCKFCSYSTKHKDHLPRHQLMHENPEKIPKHKCEKCEYETKYKHNLTCHMVVHQDSALFKCEKCPYQSKRQPDVKKHMLTHFSEKRYSCEQCTYCSPFLDNLHRHMRVHQTDRKKVTIRCDQCDFQTKYKKTLRRHKQRHEATLPTFKCDKCKYCTIETNMLKKHQLKHMKLGDTMVYYCLTCNFKTKYKGALSNHMIRAKKCLRTKR